MLKREDISLSLRHAGDIKRYHTWPVLQQQTLAHHMWNQLRIWIELYGPPTPSVTIAIMTDDCGEIATGDLPHEAKRDNPPLKELTKKIESKHLEEMLSRLPGLKDKHVSLSQWDRVRIKICDLLEMAEFAFQERMLGNHYAEYIIVNISIALDAIFNDRLHVGHEYIRVAEIRFADIRRQWDETLYRPRTQVVIS